MTRDLDCEALARLCDSAPEACDYLKAFAHEGRLRILCLLSERERSVTELEHALSRRQAAVSQQLARLRLEGVISARRDGKTIYYRLSDARARQMLRSLAALFAELPAPARPAPARARAAEA